MNTDFSKKLASLVVLITMLLNPIVGLAGSLSSVESLSVGKLLGSELAQKFVGDKSQQIDMDNAHCHEPEMDQLADSSKPMHEECCEDICKCSQAGCHAPVASIGALTSLVNADSPYSFSNALNYLNPSLSSLTPPPII